MERKLSSGAAFLLKPPIFCAEFLSFDPARDFFFFSFRCNNVGSVKCNTFLDITKMGIDFVDLLRSASC